MKENMERIIDPQAPLRPCQSCGTKLTGMRRGVCRPCAYLTLLNFRMRTDEERALFERYQQDTREHRSRIEELTELLEWRIALQRGLISREQFEERYPDVEL